MKRLATIVAGAVGVCLLVAVSDPQDAWRFFAFGYGPVTPVGVLCWVLWMAIAVACSCLAYWLIHSLVCKKRQCRS